MGFFNRLKTTLFAQDEVRRRAEEEAEFHLEMRAEEYRKQGMSEAEARQKARLGYGNVLSQQEQAGDTDMLAGLEGTMRDVKVGYRRLRRSPLFLVSAVLLLAVGLGVNAAVFSVLDTLFLRSLPFPGADRLVVLKEIRQNRTSNSNPQRIADWRARVTGFEVVASSFGEAMQLREREGNRPVNVMRVVGDWIALLGAPVVEGRRFEASEFRGGKVAMLTAKSRDLARVGDTIRLGDSSYQVIGVLDNSAVLGEDVQVVTPIGEGLLDGPRKAGYLQVVARLKPGVTLASAEAEALSVAEQLGREYPDTDRGTTVRVVPAQQAWTEEAREPALYIQGAAALLLLITLVNLAGLLAARALERKKEDTVRLFLGAGRWHLIRLHLVESALLVGFGCGAAMLLAPWALALLQTNYGDDFAPIKTAVIDLRVFGFLILTGVLSTLLFASVMAWQSSREKDVRGQSQFQLRNLLIVSEAALGLVLLAASFQLVRDFNNLRFAPLGFKEQGLLSARAYLSWSTDNEVLSAAIQRGLEQTSALPGVSAVAIVDRLPLEGGSQDSPVFIQGQHEKTPETVGIRMASNNYFALMGIPVLAGQLPTDDSSVLVNETFAKRYLENNAIGRSVSTDGKTWKRVAGVVASVRYSSKDANPRPEVFYSERTQSWPMLTFVIQSSQPAAALSPILRKLWSEINADADFKGVTSMENRIDEIVVQPRRQRDVVVIFGVVALLLVVAGVYGIMASDMQRRRREMGIRIAIGASRNHIIGSALSRAGWLSLAASTIGAVLILVLLQKWVEPLSIASGIAAICTGMLLAGFIPAWRGSRADPMLALRQD
ncbi:MAG: ABC transporter permease [Acidobacteria bacterium]|nr:ABC transporter permease [Acidobacteriota bacterium]